LSGRFTQDEIRRFWEQSAEAHGEAPEASWSDVRAIELEIAEIGRRLRDGDRVLDAGCANGYSTVRFAAEKSVDILGIDYIPAMIDSARRRLDALSGRLRGTVRFEVGDLSAGGLPAGAFDKVVCTRVIINLGAWERQCAAIEACASALRPGGELLLSEASLQGWRRLNAFRREWGLPDIPMPPFNTYLDEDRLANDLLHVLEPVEISDFSSSYFVATRVFKPLLAQLPGSRVNVADPLAEFNRWAASLPPAGDYGTQKLFVFRRRG
jgi:SAM-dependent methyltransferase